MIYTDPVFEARVIQFYQNGLSAGQISKLLPIAPTTVYSLLIRHNIPRRPRGGRGWRIPTEERKLTLYLYRDQKMSMSEVGEILGLKRTSIHNRMIRWGIPRRSREEALRLARAKQTPQARHERAVKGYASRTDEQREYFQERGRMYRERQAS